ncbi:hypothetical protein DRQ26_01145 [bacterium]|nr:MAG: hypothetical protein DRQ26_01145 [bacterium]
MTPVEQTIENLLLSARRAAAEDFKRNIEKRLDYYYDRQLPYLLELISEQFAHADPLSLQPHFFNVVKPIVNEISMVYRSGARRTLFSDRGDEIDPRLSQLWQEIQNFSRYDAVMKTVNRMVNLCGTVLVKSSFRDGGIKLDILTPNLVDIVQNEDDPTQADGIAYIRPANQTTMQIYGASRRNSLQMVIHYWDSERYIRLTPTGEVIDVPGNPDGINPYGVLPFVRFSNQIPLEGFFIQGGDDLIVAQDNINLKLTQLNYIVKMQSFSVPVLIGYRGPERITVSPGKPVVVPLGNVGEQGSPDFRFETPHPQIAELIKLLEHEIIRIFRAYGIGSADFSLQGEVKSGFALVMENLKLLESRENELPFYEDAEEELFEIVKRVWNYHSSFLPAGHKFRGVKFPDDVHLQVSVNDISLPKPTAEEVAEWKFMFEHHLATPVDYLMRRYKLSEQEAQQRWEKTREWWRQYEKLM